MDNGHNESPDSREPGERGSTKETDREDPSMTTSSNIPVDANEFEGKRVLVTGGTKGMGEAIVKRLTRAGATVVTTARSALPNSQAPDLFVHADISTLEGVAKVVKEILDRFGGVDILVNNVGGSCAKWGSSCLER